VVIGASAVTSRFPIVVSTLPAGTDGGTALALVAVTVMRVTQTDGRDGLRTLRVEGRLTEQTMEELRMACEAILSERRTVEIELTGLQFVDTTGASMLRSLARQGVALVGGSGFVTAVLRDDSAAGTTDSDDALVARLRAGEGAAYETLVRQYGGRMLSTARRFMVSEDEARDVVQEAFIAAFKSVGGFNGTARLSTWLQRIVVNAALMKLRTRRRRREDSIEGLLPGFNEDGCWASAPANWETPADTLLEQRETRVRVRAAIDELPASYRTVLMLRDIEELDTDEAAVALGITPNAVKVRLHRARQALKTLLERDLPGAAPAAAHSA
jgi:RNA polymerase sigma-70 factor (ECF subfamily)